MKVSATEKPARLIEILCGENLQVDLTILIEIGLIPLFKVTQQQVRTQARVIKRVLIKSEREVVIGQQAAGHRVEFVSDPDAFAQQMVLTQYFGNLATRPTAPPATTVMVKAFRTWPPGWQGIRD